MSTPGRGRGYTGRHHLREPRPGDDPDLDAARTLAELSPRATEPRTEMEKKEDAEKEDPSKEAKTEVKYHVNIEDEGLKELLSIDEQFRPLLVLLEQFSLGEDGIQFNRKLRHFESTVTTMCPDEVRLQQAFASFRAAALLNSVTARKLAAVGASFTRQQRQQLLRGALLNVVMQGTFSSKYSTYCVIKLNETQLYSRCSTAKLSILAAALLNSVTARKQAAVGASFTRQQRQQLLREALLNVVMQGTFSKLDVLERANPQFLINAANLMGDYFAEARLCNGNKVHILASPLLQYMRALLASDDIRAHRSLATQLMQNGRELLSQHTAQELDDLSISIRLRLLSPPPVSIIWLLLSADLCLNKFLPLPNILQQFYASHLELTPDENYSEVSYGSWKKSPEKDDFRSDVSTDSVAEKVSQNVSQISLSDDVDAKPKLRPILGAGAGLLRQEQALSVSQDTFETWTAKSCLSKRYDLNTWRQAEEEKEAEEPVFNPSVLPPNFPVTVPVPDYPPPQPTRFNYPENMANYLQQGDGAYIQNQYPPTTTANFNQQGDTYQFAQNERPQPEKVNNEIQKNAANRRPIENWRREKSDLKEDPNRNRQRNWTRQRSKDNMEDDDEKTKDGERFPRSSSRNSRDSRPVNRMTRRNSGESSESLNTNSGKTPPRRHVTEVPRNTKYWDHDDRCDKDYNS